MPLLPIPTGYGGYFICDPNPSVVLPADSTAPGPFGVRIQREWSSDQARDLLETAENVYPPLDEVYTKAADPDIPEFERLDPRNAQAFPSLWVSQYRSTPIAYSITKSTLLDYMKMADTYRRGGGQYVRFREDRKLLGLGCWNRAAGTGTVRFAGSLQFA